MRRYRLEVEPPDADAGARQPLAQRLSTLRKSSSFCARSPPPPTPGDRPGRRHRFRRRISALTSWGTRPARSPARKEEACPIRRSLPVPWRPAPRQRRPPQNSATWFMNEIPGGEASHWRVLVTSADAMSHEDDGIAVRTKGAYSSCMVPAPAPSPLRRPPDRLHESIDRGSLLEKLGLEHTEPGSSSGLDRGAVLSPRCPTGRWIWHNDLRLVHVLRSGGHGEHVLEVGGARPRPRVPPR